MAIFYADSGSFKSLTITGSMKIVNGGVMQGTASYALTASYAMNGGGGGGLSGGTTNYIPLWTGASSQTSSIIYQSSSNIGIGTTTPGGKLQVNGTMTINGAWNGNSTNGLHFGFESNTGTIYSLENLVAWRSLRIAANPLILNSYGGGNVGIGTETPQVPLDIAGDAGGTGGAGGATYGPRLLVYGTNGNPYYLAGMGIDLGQAGSALGVFTGYNSAFTVEQATSYETFPYTSYTTRLTVAPGGNVGIGTTSPATRLHVYNDSDTILAHFEGVNGYPIQLRATDEGLWAGYESPQGSIGNSAGILSVKYGGSDTEWAPISYNVRVGAIDLNTQYQISYPGVYEVTVGSETGGNAIQLPDAVYNPLFSFGNKVTIINKTDEMVIINTSGGSQYVEGKSTVDNVLSARSIVEFVSDGTDWRRMPSMKYLTYDGIDLSASSDYIMPSKGVYKINTASINSLLFPNPNYFDGEMLTILNLDDTNSAAIKDNGCRPHDADDSTMVELLPLSSYQFVSIGGYWRLVSRYNV